MKNFKRVISAVIAMALSVSSFVAVSANKFSDVAETASYAEAIDVLSALKIVNGYEDGTFKPEGEITRAEAATMIVGALNMTSDAKAAAGSSQFGDVNEKANWATGYVNVGVAQGFISGMGDGSFTPQDNVTYAQMCVMLTKITGYGDYAQSYGGYPTGYTTMAASAGINKGVSAANDAKLTRGQVAQMLYNAITVPMLGITEYKIDGNTYAKLDGKKENFKSILSDKFTAYEGTATVANLGETGMVTLDNIKTDYETADGIKDNIKVFAIIEDGVDLTDKVAQEVKVIVVIDELNKNHVIYAATTGTVDTKEYDVEDYVSTTFEKDGKIKFGNTKESFDTENGIDVYVNGYAAGTIKTNAEIEDILSDAVGTVKLAKTGDSKVYNTIFVDKYLVSQVTSVSYKNETTTVKFAKVGNAKAIEITDDAVANEDVKIKVMLGDEEIELKDVKENDVIAIKAKPSSDATISSGDITVLVSRNTIAGRVTSIDVEDTENAFVVDGTEYAAVDKHGVNLEVGKSYNVIYLDAFGRIYAYNDEAVEETAKYAIVAREIDGEVTLVLPDGSRKVYEAKDATVAAAAKALVAKADIEDRMVEYTVKASTGELASIKAASVKAIDGEYIESINKLGVAMLGDTTSIVTVENASSYKDYKAMPKADLVDGDDYEGFGIKTADATTYAFIVITKAGTAITANSRFAVVAGGFALGTNEDGDEVRKLKVLLNGEVTTLDFPGTTTSKKSLEIGDAFFYTLDSDGLVEDVVVISLDQIKAQKGAFDAVDDLASYIDTDKWSADASDKADIKLINGIVVYAGSTVRIAAVPSGDVLDTTDFESFALASDCTVYTYDDDDEVLAKNKLDAEGSLVASTFAGWKITESEGGVNDGKIYWTTTPAEVADMKAAGIPAKNFDKLEGSTTEEEANYVLAMVVDNQVVEIYQIQR